MIRFCTIGAVRCLLATAVLVISLPLRGAAATDLEPADRALQQGRADDAIVLLQASIAAMPQNPPAHQLLCRVYYSEEQYDSSIHECELAVESAPNQSDNQMWLGRAYGLKASNVGPLSAFSLAKKVRVAFERAVQLDSHNVPAATALGEYYIAAPALIGGGLNKAATVASQLRENSPAQADRLLAMIAEKKKDLVTAESEFRLAVSESKKPEAWVDLGDFYQRQQQMDKAVAALQSALDADHAHDAALSDIASVLMDAHCSPDVAEKVLRLYLASAAKSEDAPAFKVHVQLGKVLALRGDSTGAHQEYKAALALASSYAPARKALGES